MRKAGGDLAADGFLKALQSTTDALRMTQEDRDIRRVAQPNFWNRQAENTLDRATAMMPKLLYERLDEIGTDFAIIYPTAGLRLPRIKDDAARRAVIRAYNIVSAEYFRPFADRMTPAAIIPMHTPEEAIEELEFVTSQLGSKVGMFGSGMPRPVQAAQTNDPESQRFTVWYDVLGIDSPYDYDTVWAKCVELGIAPTFHSSASGQGLRNSPSNFVYNHIGHFAAAGHAVAKGIFLGGVTRRFPQLNFAFLEGGVGWGCQLFGDLIEHWERRGAPALKRMDPDKLDRNLLLSLVEQHGYGDILGVLKSRDGWPDPNAKSLTGNRAELDDFAACQITRKEDWVDLFAKPYYFGCEADDRMNATAFGKGNPFGSKLNAIYSSDIGHFDVIDFRDPLPRGVRAGRGRPHHRGRFPQLRLRQPGPAVGQAEPQFLQGHRGREGSRRDPGRRPPGGVGGLNRDLGFDCVVIGFKAVVGCVEQSGGGQGPHIRVDIAVVAAQRLRQCTDAGRFVPADMA
jgi:predicted TIM-barrel fold metal-dependent hydrolase